MMHTSNGSKSQAGTVRLVDEISQWWKTSLHKAQIGEVASVPEAEAEAGDDMTSTAGRIIFQVVDSRGFQDFGVDVDHMVIVGRTDRETRLIPDVDLTPYGALDHGVSRQHAVILPTDEGLCLIDLDSSNGTALNDKRVAPGQKHILRSGDRLTFGTLRLIVRVSHSLRRGGEAAPPMSRRPLLCPERQTASRPCKRMRPRAGAFYFSSRRTRGLSPLFHAPSHLTGCTRAAIIRIIDPSPLTHERR